MEKLRIIVGGFIGLFPTGGATFDYIQYPLGLKKLGHEVYYIEDTQLYPIYQQKTKKWDDASECIAYLKRTMEYFGFEDAWCYRDIASGRFYGMPQKKVMKICKTADVFINLSCSTFMRDEYFNIPKRILLDSDPMFTQIQYYQELKQNICSSTKQMLETHNYLFSFGENIGNKNCKIPTFGYNWLSTRQPVCLNLWRTSSQKNKFHITSVMNWSGRKKLIFDNKEWGQKDIEFIKFISLPQKLPSLKFEIVINPPQHEESTFNKNEILAYKWSILKPEEAVPTFEKYKEFIAGSLAEFSVAKETYVKSKSGWFSCRSACYLAASKPVVTQETGWSLFIPSGNGLFSFNNMEDAVEAMEEIASNYPKHSKAAVEIAETYFNSNIVLNQMLNHLY